MPNKRVESDYKMPSHKGSYIFVLVSVLYIASLCVPALVTTHIGRTDGNEVWYGWKILVWGWLGIVQFQPAWYANPMFVRGLLAKFRGDSKAALRHSLVASSLSIWTFLWFLVPLPGDEGGVTKLSLSYLHIGFFFWFLAINLFAGFLYFESK